MASLPMGRAEVVHCAWPEASVTAEQPVMAAAFAVKLTVPVGDDPPLTAAVNVTDWPEVEGFALEVTVVVVVALLTTWDNVGLVLPP